MTTRASVENPFAGQGSVLLDIGGDVGALVVTMPLAIEGVEIELAFEPRLAALQDVRPILFAGARSLFLRVMA